jgi:arginyl-tRNA synthetase
MNTIQTIISAFNHFLTTTYDLSPAQLSLIDTSINVDDAKKEFGDINSNAALVLAKELKKNPRDIAQEIVATFTHQLVEKIELAGPGFLNLFLSPKAYILLAQELHSQKEAFFKLDNTIAKKNYSLEFVSANPTGPLHIGHGRGAIIGDVLGNILTFIGHKATKEFYINDAGVQIEKLGISLKIRCQQLLGQEIPLPEDGYHGEYLIELAKQCIQEHGSGVVENKTDFFAQYGKEQLLAALKETLAAYGVYFDVWFSESTLHKDGSVQRGIDLLTSRGYTYEKEGALWFKSTDFGDDKDRVLRKSSGELTYAAADVAYLDNKIKRKFDHLIMVLGQDHHSYVTRLKGILQAMGYDKEMLDVILYQLVTIKESGELIRMSKRTGKLVTLKDIIDTVGVDVARFFYLNRKADAHLEFDVALALKRTDENPVYYSQYAYVRMGSVLAKAREFEPLKNLTIDDLTFISPAEHLLIKKMVCLKNSLLSISKNYQTQLLTAYIFELATLFHRYYSKNKIVDLENEAQTKARLVMTTLLRDTCATVFDLLGISKPEKM